MERGAASLQRKGERIDTVDASDGDKLRSGARRDRASSAQSAVKAVQRRIGKMEKVEKPFEEEPFTLAIDSKKREGTVELSLDAVRAGYPDGIAVGPVSFRATMGTRICFMGMNGAGKSTLLKTVMGSIPPLAGSVEVTEGVRFGDMLQHHERADRESSAIDFFMEQTGSGIEGALHMLKKAGFTDQAVAQKIAGLSSGMRARLLFAVFMAQGVNVLVLDEPTNHLDIEAVTALKDMLKTYAGIVLLVSHNRWFLEDVSVDMYYDIADSAITRIADFEQYLKGMQARADTIVKRMRRTLRQ